MNPIEEQIKKQIAEVFVDVLNRSSAKIKFGSLELNIVINAKFNDLGGIYVVIEVMT